MFETSYVRSQSVAVQKKATLLSISVAIHSLAVIAAVIASIQSMKFPTNAPRQFEIFRPVVVPSVPPPLGVAHGRRDAAPAPKPRTQTAPRPLSAPQFVPETIPQTTATPAISEGPTTGTDAGPGSGTTSDLPWGDPNGVPNGVDIGQQVSGEPGTTYVPGGDVKPAVVLRRVQPEYPLIAVKGRINGVVVIRCIIDKSGTIRDPEVVRSSFAAFEVSAINAVRKWTFAPGTRHGKPVDTWFELTVTFRVH